MEIMILLKVLGFLVGTLVYLKGGLLTMEHYFRLTNLIAVSLIIFCYNMKLLFYTAILYTFPIFSGIFILLHLISLMFDEITDSSDHF